LGELADPPKGCVPLRQRSDQELHGKVMKHCVFSKATSAPIGRATRLYMPRRRQNEGEDQEVTHILHNYKFGGLRKHINREGKILPRGQVDPGG
jgi:hypothetical protein